MKMNMVETVKNNIERYNLLNDTQTILAAVSGGPDSMAMIHCLYRLRSYFGFRLLVAHVNHGVRGEFAKRDQEFVEVVSKELGLQYYTTNVDMAAYGREHKMTSEEAGRLLRYGFFRDILEQNGGGRIAVAHNKNDQAETVLHRIIRGTGLDGIRAMSIKSGDIIRPLINITRGEIESFIEENSIDTVEDHTNLETVYTRNKIRLELLPYLRDNFNPNIIDSLYRLSEIAQSDLSILEREMEKKYNLVVKKSTNNSIIFKGDIFSKEDEGSGKRLIRMAIQNLLGDLNGFGEVHFQSVVDLFSSGITGKSLDIGRGLSAEVSYNDFIIQIAHVQMDKLEEAKLRYGENRLKSWGIVIIVEKADESPEKKSRNEIHVDEDKIQGSLIIRQRRDGDRVSPVGMKGTKKIKDIFIDNKVPRKTRNITPIIADGKGIIWIPGQAVSRDYVADSGSRRILRIAIKSIEEEKN